MAHSVTGMDVEGWIAGHLQACALLEPRHGTGIPYVDVDVKSHRRLRLRLRLALQDHTTRPLCAVVCLVDRSCWRMRYRSSLTMGLVSRVMRLTCCSQ